MAAEWASPVGLTPADDNAAVDAFMQWCRRKRVRLPKCRIAVTATTGRCVQAAADIAEGEVVVEVPDSAVLMAEDSSIGGLLQEWGLTKPADEPLHEVQGLILALMHERLLGSKSRWAPYLDFMPKELPHMPMFWTDAELAELKGTAAHDKMVGRVQSPADAPTRVQQLWEELALPFIQENPELGLPMGEEGRELYRWATAVVSSYSFMLGDDLYHALVPIWDALNHITGRANIRLHHNERRGVLQMIATRDIVAGEEVVNDYGALSNAELLRAYGYVERLSNHSSSRDKEPGSSYTRGTEWAALRERLSAAGIPGNSSIHVQVPLPLILKAVRSGTGAAHTPHTSGAIEPASSDAKQRRSKAATADNNRHVAEGETEAGQAERGGVSGKEAEAGEEEGADGAGEEGLAQKQMAGRVRLCKRHKLLPANGVVKLFYDRAPNPCLAEILRLMLLPKQDFKAFAVALSCWRPPMALPLSSEGQGPLQLPGSSGSEDGAEGQLPGSCLANGYATAVGDTGGKGSGSSVGGAAAAGQMVKQAYLRLVEVMTSRYTCSLEADLKVLSDPKQLQQLPPRLQAAVVARADEKACWAALKAWLEQPGAEQLLQRQCAEAWQQALGHSRKRKQQHEQQQQKQQHPQQQQAQQMQQQAQQMQQQAQPGQQQREETDGTEEGEGRGKDGRPGKGKAGAKGSQCKRPESGTVLQTKPLMPVGAGFSFNFAL